MNNIFKSFNMKKKLIIYNSLYTYILFNIKKGFIGFFLPCIETGLAAYNGGEGAFCAGVQCLLWPFCLPYLRYRSKYFCSKI
jgi:hypothetical protein